MSCARACPINGCNQNIANICRYYKAVLQVGYRCIPPKQSNVSFLFIMADESGECLYERARRLTIAMAASRMKSLCARLSLHSVRLCAVPSHYYSLALHERAALVSAPSIDHMCKTVVFENTKSTVENCEDPFHSRFYAVIVQYTSEVSTTKFENFTFNLAQEHGRAVSKRRFHWRLASPADSLRLTGYVNNAGLPPANAAPYSPLCSRTLQLLLSDSKTSR